MENKGVYFARKFILAVGVFFLLLILPAVNAEAKEVSLVKGDAIRYMGYSTHYYYVDGNLAFCLEPDMNHRRMVHIAHQNWIRSHILVKQCITCTVDRDMSNISKVH